MKIKLCYLAVGLLALLGSFVVSSQRISAYEATDRLSASSAAAPSVLGTTKTPLGDAIPAPGIPVTYTNYLPVLMKNYVQGIYGYLTQNGVPIGGISLDLEFVNGPNTAPVATTTTSPSGYYLFTGVPALGAGQTYYVQYQNPGDTDSRLYFWASGDITSYGLDSSVSLGTSDLANIALNAPDSEATIALPYLFQWTRRPATPSDSYFWVLFDPASSARTLVGPLGYVGSYYRTILPSGFTTNVMYGWYVGFIEPGAMGGIGISYYYNPVAFSNTGASVFSPPDAAPGAIGRRNRLPPAPHRKQ